MATQKFLQSNFIEFLKNAFFPKFCFGCGQIGVYICTSCSRSIRSVDTDICPICNRVGYLGLTHLWCKKNDTLDGLISFFKYEGLAKKIIMKFKYQLIYDASFDIVNAIEPGSINKIFTLKKVNPDIVLVPVPLHIKRKHDRGFNQSEKLFKELGMQIGIPVVNNLVIRKKYTIPQAHIKSKKERVKNIEGAFAVVKNVQNKDLIICDDVWTTGTTIKELCKEFKRNNARHVYALTIARVYV